jgi:DNA invertase Pin-like site-specific DNA recombinase
VSTAEQNLDLQTDALIRAGVDRANIFTDKVSGIAKKRPGRDLAIRQCREGDTLVVWKLDRISRSLLDLLTLLDRLTASGVKFKSLTETLDISGPMGRAVVAILGAVAQLERDMIQQRSRAGVARAIERGVKFGQPTIFTPEVQAKVWQWIHDGESVKDVAKRLGCHEGTVRRIYTFPVLEAIRAGKKPKINTHSKDKKHRKK